MKNFTKIFVTIFYIGFINIAPGTFGSAASILILFLLFKYSLLSLSMLIIIFIILLFASNYFINIFSSLTNSQDSKHIVIDEFIGIYSIFLFYDYVFTYNDIVTLILIFLIFRFFDIIKIFPADIIDKNFKNGYGVILDDIVAGIYTVLLMVVINAII